MAIDHRVLRSVMDGLIEADLIPAYEYQEDSARINAKAALDAIPDGWAKIDGEWVLLPHPDDLVASAARIASDAGYELT